MRSLLLLALLGLPTLTHAVDIDPFEAAGSLAHGNGGVATESATLAGEGIAFGAVASVADDLMVIRFPSSGSEVPFLSQAFGTTLYAGYTYEDKFRIELFAPMYFGVNAPGVGYRGFAMGDMVLQGLIPVYSASDAFNLAVLPAFGLPTGKKRALMHQGFSGRINVAMSGEFDFGLGYAANLGSSLMQKGSIQGVDIGSTFDFRTAAWYAPTDEFRIGFEYDSRFSYVGNNHVAEGRLFAKVISPDGITLSVAAGRGFIAGVGAPDYRVITAITYGPTARDRDKDTILDRDDACPLEPEDFDGFEDVEGCPDPDNDGDTILDVDDSCPMEPEDFDGFDDEDGCPDADNDEDGLLDVDDRCPDDAGPEDKDGCPDSDEDGIVDIDDQCMSQPGIIEFNGCGDTDMDRVPDYRDVCPDEQGPEDEDPAVSDGCPKEAYVTADRIKFNQRILFQTGKAVIKTQSYGILDAITSIMKNNPHVRMVEIAGHTDNDGADDFNMGLSKRRAASVMNYLLEKGIEESRLQSQGYGETEPVDSNRTEFGRANNRRVEFRILEQDEPEVQERSISENMSYSWLTIVTPDAVDGYVTVSVNGEELPHRAPIERMLVEPGERTVSIDGGNWSWEQAISVDRAQIYTMVVPDSVLETSAPAEPEGNTTDEVMESDLPLAIPVDGIPADEEDGTPEAPEDAGTMERPPMDDAMDEETTTPMDVAPPQPEETPDVSTPELEAPTTDPTPASEEPDATMGTLSIFFDQPGTAAVFIDGLEIEAAAPLDQYTIAPGPHAVRVVNEDRGLNHIEVVQVVAGENISMALTLTPLPEGEAPAPTEAEASTEPAPVTEADSGKKKKKTKKKKSKKKKVQDNVEQAEDSPQTTPSEPASDEVPAEPDVPAEDPADMPAPEPEPAEETANPDDPWGTGSEDTSGSSSGGNDPWSPQP